MSTRSSVLLAAILLAGSCASAQTLDGRCAPSSRPSAELRADLARALSGRDETAIRETVALAACHFADQPIERPERYVRVEGNEPPLVREEARALAGALFQQLSTHAWWTTEDLAPGPLRVPAKFIENTLALWRLTDDGTYLEAARTAGDYLVELQEELGSGGLGFPVPDPSSMRDEDRAGLSFLESARRRGVYDQIVRNGWIIDDTGDGGLNYDAGLVGEALLSLHRATGDARYLNSALRTADWAASRPLVPNFNYNGFTAVLLARAAEVTGNPYYLDEAIVRIRLGVLSGQIKEGPRAGSWIDPHNGRLVYRFVMLGQLSRFINAMPTDHPDRAELRSALLLGLLSAESQMRENGGIGNVESALGTYCALGLAGMADPDFVNRNRDMERSLWIHVVRGLRQPTPVVNGEIGCIFDYAFGDGAPVASDG